MQSTYVVPEWDRVTEKELDAIINWYENMLAGLHDLSKS